MKGCPAMQVGPAEISRDEVTGVVLAGGRSSRFGSDKALALLPGTGVQFIQRICDTLAGVVVRVMIIGRSTAESAPGVEVVPDRLPDQGPAGGLATALEFATSRIVLAVSCDQPLLESRDLGRLIETCQYAAAAVFRSGDRAFHPLPCAIRTGEARVAVKAGAGAAGRPLRDLIKALEPVLIDPGSAADRLVDIDTPADFAALSSRLSRERSRE
jgi:molybdopterin-guanine dinucleotide biosynthesis protein A